MQRIILNMIEIKYYKYKEPEPTMTSMEGSVGEVWPVRQSTY